MQIDNDDRAFLISNMSDESVAALLAQPLGWVQKRRAYLAEQAAEPAPSNGDAKSYEAPSLPPLAPAGLTGEALAEWLYDNTQHTFAEIAATTGVPEARVEAIANGEPPTPEKAPLAAVAPPPVCRPQKPANRRPAPALAPARSPRAEIPARVLRWARWFLIARWRLADVAHLFDVEAGDLAAALERRQRAA